jgi:hypothetical protein
MCVISSSAESSECEDDAVGPGPGFGLGILILTCTPFSTFNLLAIFEVLVEIDHRGTGQKVPTYLIVLRA